eukprot:1028725-Pyramimonas_sp.AAC.1
MSQCIPGPIMSEAMAFAIRAKATLQEKSGMATSRARAQLGNTGRSFSCSPKVGVSVSKQGD